MCPKIGSGLGAGRRPHWHTGEDSRALQDSRQPSVLYWHPPAPTVGSYVPVLERYVTNKRTALWICSVRSLGVGTARASNKVVEEEGGETLSLCLPTILVPNPMQASSVQPTSSATAPGMRVLLRHLKVRFILAETCSTKILDLDC